MSRRAAEVETARRLSRMTLEDRRAQVCGQLHLKNPIPCASGYLSLTHAATMLRDESTYRVADGADDPRTDRGSWHYRPSCDRGDAQCGSRAFFLEAIQTGSFRGS